MRRILFRGKSIRNGHWRKGDLLRANGDKLIIGTTSWSVVNPNTIGQYTGLKDKNGTRIFEGDILKCGKRFIGKVIWNDIYASFEIRTINSWADTSFWLLHNAEFEVIGNIHDNPELLKAEVQE